MSNIFNARKPEKISELEKTVIDYVKDKPHIGVPTPRAFLLLKSIVALEKNKLIKEIEQEMCLNFIGKQDEYQTLSKIEEILKNNEVK